MTPNDAAAMERALRVRYGDPEYRAYEAICLFWRWGSGAVVRDCICERCWEVLE